MPLPSQTAELHKVSPCHHGVEWGVKHLPVNVEFSFPECPRWHKVTEERYPEKVRMR